MLNLSDSGGAHEFICVPRTPEKQIALQLKVGHDSLKLPAWLGIVVHTLDIPTPGKQKQEGEQFMSSLGCLVSSRSAWVA